MYSWSRHYAAGSPAILQHVGDTRCRYDETTDSHCLKQKQCGSLLLVMQYYHEKVNPSCPGSCSCFLTQVQEVMKERKERSYTVQVNCTARNLTYFPKLPVHTRIVDLSDNKVSRARNGLGQRNASCVTVHERMSLRDQRQCHAMQSNYLES